MNTSEGAVQWYIEQLVTSAVQDIQLERMQGLAILTGPYWKEDYGVQDVKFVKSCVLLSRTHASPCSEGTYRVPGSFQIWLEKVFQHCTQYFQPIDRTRRMKSWMKRLAKAFAYVNAYSSPPTFLPAFTIANIGMGKAMSPRNGVVTLEVSFRPPVSGGHACLHCK